MSEKTRYQYKGKSISIYLIYFVSVNKILILFITINYICGDQTQLKIHKMICLPNDIINLIINVCDVEDLVYLKYTCKHLNQFITNVSISKLMLKVKKYFVINIILRNITFVLMKIVMMIRFMFLKIYI